ncbi:MAG TPA: ATP-binding cassette domain-containing protein [Prolixibacteraceae bacterium]|nr:ATP-binding cassette domain-containing protein [Prolixibacteraceae bacterium]
MEIFQANNVVKEFAGHVALSSVSISVKEASIFGLLGPNGAGKTTLIRIINQITAPDSGELFFEGRPIKASDIYQIGYLPEERGLYKKMKVGEQALYLAQLKGMSKKDALKNLKYWFEKFEIQAWWGKKVEELSKGMAQKVQFITTIIHQPKLLIFDEPFTGFDPINTNLIKNEILELKKKGTTIIFSTHNMSSVEEICDHIALINQSKKILDGQIDQVREKFKTNTFEIVYRGETPDLQSQLGSSFDILEHDESAQLKQMKVRFLNGQSNNELLRILLNQFEIVSFNEIIPSMNDVFIHVVEQNNREIKM